MCNKIIVEIRDRMIEGSNVPIIVEDGVEYVED